MTITEKGTSRSNNGVLLFSPPQAFHSIQAARSRPPRTPDIFLLLFYVHDMRDVCDILLQEF